MSSGTTNHPPLSLERTLGEASIALPSLENLLQMTAECDVRNVISGVDWDFYERLLDSIPPEVHLDVDFDGKDLEFMSPGMVHDEVRGLMGQLIQTVAQVLRISYKSLGQTTWKRIHLARGLESDDCYYFQAEKIAAFRMARAGGSTSIDDYPNPDLSVEVDISRPKIDRAGIYSALRVPELWRFEGSTEIVVIERLGADGAYHPVDTSGFLPIRAEEVRRWIMDEDSSDEMAWTERLRAWVADELVQRLGR